MKAKLNVEVTSMVNDPCTMILVGTGTRNNRVECMATNAFNFASLERVANSNSASLLDAFNMDDIPSILER